MVKKTATTLTVIAILFLQGSCAVGCCYEGGVENLMGRYEIVSVSKISGGLTNEETANSWIGSAVILETSHSSALGLVIESPKYSQRCLSNKRPEGEVSNSRNPWDYDVLPERICISMLDVSKMGEPSPFFEFEIVDGELWWIFDGWLIVARQ